MLLFWELPWMGSAVSKGALATYEAPNGAGLVIARNGARPVAVGPCLLVNTEPIGLELGRHLTGIEFGGGLEVLRDCSAGSGAGDAR